MVLLAEKIVLFLVKIMELFTPRLALKVRIYRKWGYEPELELLPHLCEKNKISFDVGAHKGLYTYYLSKYSKKCWAFEPNPRLASLLRRTFGEKIIVKQIPLSMSKFPKKQTFINLIITILTILRNTFLINRTCSICYVFPIKLSSI